MPEDSKLCRCFVDAGFDFGIAGEVGGEYGAYKYLKVLVKGVELVPPFSGRGGHMFLVV